MNTSYYVNSYTGSGTLFEPTQYAAQHAMKEWLSAFPVQYAATLHFKNGTYQKQNEAEQALRIFNDKLNKCIWGRTKYEALQQKVQLSILYALHNHSTLDDRTHAHLAIPELPSHLTAERFEEKLLEAARHTAGIVNRWKLEEMRYAAKTKKEFAENTVKITQYYRNIYDMECKQIDCKLKRAVYFAPISTTSEKYMSYIVRRINQGSDMDTILINLLPSAKQ